MSAAFSFWLAKSLAELTVAVAFFLMVGLGALIFYWVTTPKRRKP